MATDIAHKIDLALPHYDRGNASLANFHGINQVNQIMSVCLISSKALIGCLDYEINLTRDDETLMDAVSLKGEFKGKNTLKFVSMRFLCGSNSAIEQQSIRAAAQHYSIFGGFNFDR